MRKALIIGIDDYPCSPLKGCVNDALKMRELLKTNADGSPNFQVKMYTDTDVTRKFLKNKIEELFANETDAALLYFSGHGYIDSFGGHIVTADLANEGESVSMNELMLLCNNSKARHKIIILDCCYSGAAGVLSCKANNIIEIADGVTILASCRQNELAVEVDGQGVFTSLLIDALKGQCADLIGHISPASVYAYIDRVLGAWDQRPMFKTNISSFISLREVEPPIEKSVLRKITDHFPTKDKKFELDPTYEDQEPGYIAENAKIFKELQKMESVGLVQPVGEQHMYFAAKNRKSCELTPLGKMYWDIVHQGRV